jgi:hypothetical protein
VIVERGLASPGFRGDERVGAILRKLFDDVLDDPRRNERGALLRRAAELLAAENPPGQGGPSR